MKKNELKKCMNEGFSNIAPDICEDIWMEALEKPDIFVERTDEQHITLFEKVKNYLTGFSWKKRAWGSVGAALACMCFFLFMEVYQKEICIIVDVNPSIEILADESYMVKRLNALNADGQDVLNQLEWKKNDSIENIMDELLEELAQQEYLQEGSGILLSVSKTKEEEYQMLQDTLGSRIYQKLEHMEITGVKAAFWHAEKPVGRAGLETELVERNALDKVAVENMSVSELIEVCEEDKTLHIQVPEKYAEKVSASEKAINREENKEEDKEENKGKNKENVILVIEKKAEEKPKDTESLIVEMDKIQKETDKVPNDNTNANTSPNTPTNPEKKEEENIIPNPSQNTETKQPDENSENKQPEENTIKKEDTANSNSSGNMPSENKPNKQPDKEPDKNTDQNTGNTIKKEDTVDNNSSENIPDNKQNRNLNKEQNKEPNKGSDENITGNTTGSGKNENRTENNDFPNYPQKNENKQSGDNTLEGGAKVNGVENGKQKERYPLDGTQKYFKNSHK